MVITKNRPSNPHFFKVILFDSFQQLAIPIGFHKYLSDEKCEEGEAVLRNSGKSWRVNVSGFCFKEGWADFARDYHLHIGDFVVFKHEGRMVFDVLVFDRSTCEKVCPSLLHHQNEIKRETRKFENEGKEPILEKKIMSASTHSGARKAAAKEYVVQEPNYKPSFVTSLKNSTLASSFLYVPKEFTRNNGLLVKGCKYNITLKDEKARIWEMKMKIYRRKGEVYMKGDWHTISVANGLKEGDNINLQLTTNEAMQTMEFLLL